MLKNQKTKDTLWIIGGTILFAVIAGLGSMQSGEVYGSLQLPPLAPPSWLYGVVWPVLYALMALATIFIQRRVADSPRKRQAISLYWTQLIVNAIWPYLFFFLQARLLAFLWLILLLYLVILLAIRYRRLYPLSFWLLLPYVLWTAFAVYLNGFTWLLNR